MRLSFVIPSFNCAEFLPHAVDSCLKQTYKDIEVVIVNDASTDSTRDYLDWLGEQPCASKIKIIHNETNRGRSRSRNVGNAAATGEIIAVLDADDISTVKRAEITVAKFRSGSKFVHGEAYMMDAVGRNLGLMRTDVFNRESARESLLNGIVHSTVAMTKELALEFPYSEGIASRIGCDDWEQQTCMAAEGVKFDYIPAPLCAYRHGVGISSQRNEDEVRKFKTDFLAAFKVEVPA